MLVGDHAEIHDGEKILVGSAINRCKTKGGKVVNKTLCVFCYASWLPRLVALGMRVCRA